MKITDSFSRTAQKPSKAARVSPSDIRRAMAPEMELDGERLPPPSGYPVAEESIPGTGNPRMAQANPMEEPMEPLQDQKPSSPNPGGENPAGPTPAPGLGQPGAPGAPGGKPPAPPKPPSTRVRTQEMWGPDGSFERSVEADGGVSDLVTLHRELSQMGLASEQPQGQQQTQPMAQPMAQQPGTDPGMDPGMEQESQSWAGMPSQPIKASMSDLIKEAQSGSWWDKMSPAQQQKYKEKHPKSKQSPSGKDGPGKEGPEKETSPQSHPDKDPMDSGNGHPDKSPFGDFDPSKGPDMSWYTEPEAPASPSEQPGQQEMFPETPQPEGPTPDVKTDPEGFARSMAKQIWSQKSTPQDMASRLQALKASGAYVSGKVEKYVNAAQTEDLGPDNLEYLDSLLEQDEKSAGIDSPRVKAGKAAMQSIAEANGLKLVMQEKTSPLSGRPEARQMLVSPDGKYSENWDWVPGMEGPYQNTMSQYSAPYQYQEAFDTVKSAFDSLRKSPWKDQDKEEASVSPVSRGAYSAFAHSLTADMAEDELERAEWKGEVGLGGPVAPDNRMPEDELFGESSWGGTEEKTDLHSNPKGKTAEQYNPYAEGHVEQIESADGLLWKITPAGQENEYAVKMWLSNNGYSEIQPGLWKNETTSPRSARVYRALANKYAQMDMDPEDVTCEDCGNLDWQDLGVCNDCGSSVCMVNCQNDYPHKSYCSPMTPPNMIPLSQWMQSRGIGNMPMSPEPEPVGDGGMDMESQTQPQQLDLGGISHGFSLCTNDGICDNMSPIGTQQCPECGSPMEQFPRDPENPTSQEDDPYDVGSPWQVMGAKKTAQPKDMPPASAAQAMNFEHSNERSDGDRVVWDCAWEPDDFPGASETSMKQYLRSYVQRDATDLSTKNWGTIADVVIKDIDTDAGIATVTFQTSEQAAPQVAPAEATE